MDAKRSEDIHKINYLTFETDSVYHQASLRLGVSDCVSMILYTLYDLGEECLLSDLYKKSGTSKQTVNSALRKLETEGILFLKQHTGRAKKVCLTEKGREYTRQTAGRLFEAEGRAFDTWTTEEINTYLRLMEKYVACLRTQIERI